MYEINSTPLLKKVSRTFSGDELFSETVFQSYKSDGKRVITMSELQNWFLHHGKVLSDEDVSQIFEGNRISTLTETQF